MHNKIHCITTKQSLRTIAVTHAEQFSQHTNSIKNRVRKAVIHTLKHEFLIDNWHLMNRVCNKVRPALSVAPYWRLHSLNKYTRVENESIYPDPSQFKPSTYGSNPIHVDVHNLHPIQSNTIQSIGPKRKVLNRTRKLCGTAMCHVLF